MNKVDNLKKKIEEERRRLNEMLGTGSAQDVLLQSRKLDGLMEEYIALTE